MGFWEFCDRHILAVVFVVCFAAFFGTPLWISRKK